jgi:hypothetical protein
MGTVAEPGVTVSCCGVGVGVGVGGGVLLPPPPHPINNTARENKPKSPETFFMGLLRPRAKRTLNMGRLALIFWILPLISAVIQSCRTHVFITPKRLRVRFSASFFRQIPARKSARAPAQSNPWE